MVKSPVQILDDLFLAPDEIEETFIRAGGPGGQNVKKPERTRKLPSNSQVRQN